MSLSHNGAGEKDSGAEHQQLFPDISIQMSSSYPATRTVSQRITQLLFLEIFSDTWQIVVFLKLSVASFADKVRPRAGGKKNLTKTLIQTIRY